MSSSLSGIPIAKRRQLAATIGLFAALFVAVGLVATTGTTPGVVRIFSAVSIVVAVVLALTAWGVMRSVRADLAAQAEQRLDAAIEASVAEHGASLCSCGHDHDPTEMHVRGDACAHDGAGSDCAHDCQSCVLAAMRPSPTRPRAARLSESSGSAGLAE